MAAKTDKPEAQTTAGKSTIPAILTEDVKRLSQWIDDLAGTVQELEGRIFSKQS